MIQIILLYCNIKLAFFLTLYVFGSLKKKKKKKKKGVGRRLKGFLTEFVQIM